MGSKELKGRWYILYTRNRKETAVVDALGFESITPLVQKTKKRKGIVEVVNEPRYLNYVFVRHDGSETFFDRCVENKDVVSFAGGVYDKKNSIFPIPMSEEEVANIIEHETSKSPRVGVEAIIVEGPLANQRCQILSSGSSESEVMVTITDNCKFKQRIPTKFLKEA